MSSRSNRLAFFTASILLLSNLCAIATAKTIYVDDDATGANKGSSWTDGYTFLQEALADARTAEKPVEIRVAQGIYRPNEGLVAIPEFDWRTATFQLINGATLKGGYAGVGDPDPNERDIAGHETVLSGDLNDDDVAATDPCDLLAEPTRSDNSYHVVTGSGADETAVLDGFTIIAGNADRDEWQGNSSGGGMCNHSGSPTVANCNFGANSAVRNGGGLYNYLYSNPMVTNCTFTGNRAAYGGGMSSDNSNPTLDDCTFYANSAEWDGGGMCNSYNRPILTNCTFIANRAYNGGGMENFINCSPTVTNCTFNRNFADDNGGGMHNEYHTSTTVTNSTFNENSANENGGGMYNHENSGTILTDCLFVGNSCGNGGGGMWNSMSSPTLLGCAFSRNLASFGGGVVDFWESNSILTYCTFHGNSAGEGGGMNIFQESGPMLTNCVFSGNSADWSGGGIAITWESNPTLSNCTITDNTADSGGGMSTSLDSRAVVVNCIVHNSNYSTQGNISGDFSVSYSNIQGGFPGEGNIDADPLFANPGYWADVNDPNNVVEQNDPNAVWVDGDYHLKSETGRWDPVSGTWVKDDATSPCIDDGDPNSDWGEEVWPHGGRINMGAYGGTPQASLSAEPQEMLLPRVAYVHHDEVEVAEGYQALLTAYGCPTTLVPWQEVATTAFDDYDLIMVGADTGFANAWVYEQNVAAVEGSGKPVVGLSEGGYRYFGKLALAIGQPNGAHDNGTAIKPVDPNHPLFSEPYPIDIPGDGVLELCAATDEIMIYLYPAAPDTVTTLGLDADNAGYYPLVLENDRYLFWGFDTPAESLTEAGKRLFVNVVVRTANAAWATEAD